MKSMVMSALQAMFAGASVNPMLAPGNGGYRSGTASKRRSLSARLKEAFREANPNASLDMHRYARRYGNPGVQRRVKPFSAQR